MQVPFPELTQLEIVSSFGESGPALPDFPDMFLDGSAPRLQALTLVGIPFPALPKLLRSSHDLVNLHLSEISNAGYISPEAMAACLSSLTRLESFAIEFRFPASLPDRRSRRSPPLTRVVLPALTELSFGGFSEYFEDLVARIDAPVLGPIKTYFFNQLAFDIPQFSHFLGRAGARGSPDWVYMEFSEGGVNADFYYRKGGQNLFIRITCRTLEWQISCLTQILDHLSPCFSSMKGLDIHWGQILKPPSDFVGDMDHTQWLEFFRPLTAVQNLRIDRTLAVHVALVLRELTGSRVMEVLPELRSLSFLEDGLGASSESLQEALEPFITARQLINHPVVAHCPYTELPLIRFNKY
jgi:hypothetical protein